MAKQRGHGEGSIYQRQDGRWAASITLENRKRKTFYGKTRKEVQEKLKVALHEQQQGTLATGPQQTIKAFLEHWLEEVHKPNIRLASYRIYHVSLNKHILPVIGHVQLQKLTAQQVQALYARKVKEGFSSSVIRTMHGLLHKALDQAVSWKLISNNVCDGVSLPRAVRHEIHPLTKEQAQKLLETAQGHRLEGLLTVALATGMRRGELLSLRWQDVNIDDMSLQVRRTVGKFKGGYVENEPKTSKSRRRIVLPQFVVDVLKQHRIHQLEGRLRAGEAWIDRDLVFCNANGDYIPFTSLTTMFNALLEKAGLPHVRFHDLRHSAATILLTMGVHPKVVQELLGHSQISMTLDIYSHVIPSMQREAMNKLDDWFGGDEPAGHGQAK
jgi:integrase